MEETKEEALVTGMEISLDNLQCPSSCDSSVSTDILQCSSSLDPSSTSSMRFSIPMGADGSQSNDKNNDEIMPVRNCVAWIQNHLTTTCGPRTAPVVSQINNPAVNRKKGFLGSFYTIADKLFIFCGGLLIGSLQYPLGSNARQHFDDPGMQGIIIASVISFFISCILAPLASYLKDSESIDSVGIQIFKLLFLLVLLGLCAELCAILLFCSHSPKSVLWPLGAVGSILIVLIWASVFYVEVPQEETYYRTENRMLSKSPNSEPAISHIEPTSTVGFDHRPQGGRQGCYERGCMW